MSIPADHSATAKAIGLGGIAKLMLKASFSYRHTLAYLLRRRKFKSLYNFFYTKTLVPTGEGTGELAYYFIGNLLQKYPQLAPYPRNIEIEVSTYCNKHCITCEHTYWNEPSRNLSLEELVSLASQFPLRWVNLTGEGDAFLNKDYLAMIRYLKRRGTSVYLVDSFDLITKDIALQLVGAGVDGIYISMDGASKETYESIKVGCNYDKVINNIRQLLDAKRVWNSPIPELCIRYVINNQNAHEMADFVRVVSSLGPKELWGDGSKLHFVGLLDFPEIHHLYPDNIPEKYVQEAIEAAKNDPNSLPAIFIRTDKLPSINKCLAWMEPYFALVPEPMVLPCCAVLMSNNRTNLHNYSFGNYTKEPFKEGIWNHPYYKWFRRTVTNPWAPVPVLCRGCRAYDTTERAKKYGINYRTKEDFK